MAPIRHLKIISLLALSLAASTAFSQMKGGAKQMRLWAGPKVGVNVSSFYTDSASLYNQYKVGFLGGAVVNFTFHSNLAVLTEINFSSKGGKYKSHTDTSSIRATYSLNYLDIPLIIEIKGGDEDNTVFFQIGAQQSFLLNAKYSDTKTAGTVSTSFSNSDTDSLGVPSSDFGLLAGFGFMGSSGWCFTLRAAFGTADIPDRYNKVSIHNMVFQASLGFYFGRKYDVIGGRSR